MDKELKERILEVLEKCKVINDNEGGDRCLFCCIEMALVTQLEWTIFHEDNCKIINLIKEIKEL